MSRGTLLAAAWCVVAVSAAAAQGPEDEGFPHLDHQRVFPLCTGCHAGIESGVETAYYPAPGDCTRCHDGRTERFITWSGPRRRASNLVFSHLRHGTEVTAAGDSASCGTCHRLANSTERMAVGPPRPESCLTCHAHEAPQHLAVNAVCRNCHVALVDATDLPVERLREFPRPSTHEVVGFVAAHQPESQQAATTCAMCHAQQSCERCHVNAAAVPAIAALGRDERVANLNRGVSAAYPTPQTHEETGWVWRHADAATTRTTQCANCHAQPSCQSCHLSSRSTVIADLPTPHPGGATGVVIAAGEARVHAAGFALSHSLQAAASSETCATCHTEQTFCGNCHEGPTSSAFHLGNFRERHGAQAYGGESDCASCHNAELFCRNCHERSGLGSEGRLDVAFHTAQPTWLLGHGAAARRQLEGCTTCHAQNDCTQCHSAIGAWRINPHGPGFDPTRVEDKNRFTCLRCHRSGSPDP